MRKNGTSGTGPASPPSSSVKRKLHGLQRREPARKVNVRFTLRLDQALDEGAHLGHAPPGAGRRRPYCQSAPGFDTSSKLITVQVHDNLSDARSRVSLLVIRDLCQVTGQRLWSGSRSNGVNITGPALYPRQGWANLILTTLALCVVALLVARGVALRGRSAGPAATRRWRRTWTDASPPAAGLV